MRRFLMEALVLQPRSIRWPLGVLAGLIGISAGNVVFQAASAAEKLPPVVKQTSEEDHQRMMNLLHITELRRGHNGTNKSDPTFANYDESKANPYPDLPDPLKLKNGKTGHQGVRLVEQAAA